MKDINLKSRIEYFLLGFGSYTFHAANLVGDKGKIYALDKQPSAIKRVEEKAKMEGCGNIDTILSDGDTGLPDETVDVILLYGVLPEIKNKEPLLRELYRVLKPSGYLSTRFCFRMKRDRVLEVMKATGLFLLREQKGYILNFEKQN
jgi:ubiquinone/menaquinone biosynthesis C-methylase UbiE